MNVGLVEQLWCSILFSGCSQTPDVGLVQDPHPVQDSPYFEILLECNSLKVPVQWDLLDAGFCGVNKHIATVICVFKLDKRSLGLSNPGPKVGWVQVT